MVVSMFLVVDYNLLSWEVEYTFWYNSINIHHVKNFRGPKEEKQKISEQFKYHINLYNKIYFCMSSSIVFFPLGFGMNSFCV